MKKRPREKLKILNTTLKDLTAKYGFNLWGDDMIVEYIGNMTTPNCPPARMLCYAMDSVNLKRFQASDIGAAIIPSSLKHEVAALNSKRYLLTDDHPQEIFYQFHIDAIEAGHWEIIKSFRGENVDIAPSAVIYPNVELHDGCRIMDHAVILPNSIIGPNVVIGPNSTIGRDGFEIKQLKGRTCKVPHSGGVQIGRDCNIGASTCIDRGLFGEFTYLGPETQVDNLIHIAHNVTIGQGAVLVARSEVSGSCTLGDGVFLGASATVLPQVVIGDFSYIGAGSVVTRSIGNNTLAYGSPAKPKNRICKCRTPLQFENNQAACPRCGTQYTDQDNQ